MRSQPRDLGLTSSTRAFCSRTSPIPDPPPILPATDQTHQQGVGSITRSTSVESALHSLPKSSDSGDDGWTDDSMAELEKELGLALGEQQVESSSASTPTSPSPRSAEAPQDEIQSRECSETTGSRPEELRDACRRCTPAQGLEWEQRETRVAVESLGGRVPGEEALVGEAGGVEIRQQGELAGWPALGDQQNQVEVDDMDDPMDKEATETASHATGDRQSPFSTAWDTHPAACWTPNKDNPVPSRIGRTSKQV